jgi:hypothetical protein
MEGCSGIRVHKISNPASTYVRIHRYARTFDIRHCKVCMCVCVCMHVLYVCVLAQKSTHVVCNRSRSLDVCVRENFNIKLLMCMRDSV